MATTPAVYTRPTLRQNGLQRQKAATPRGYARQGYFGWQVCAFAAITSAWISQSLCVPTSLSSTTRITNNRDRIEAITRALEACGFDTVCIVRDVERWGEVDLAPVTSWRTRSGPLTGAIS